jgi:1-acyl-sn-glycerol-3-phosphate acyltransferase
MNRGIVFDGDYPYVDESRGFRFKRFWVRVLLRLIVFPMISIRLGLKVKGKENLRKNRELIKKGVISCSTHVHMCDYIAIMNAIKPIKPYVLTWNKNVNGESGPLVRLVGGVPIPDKSIAGDRAYLKAISKILDGGWLHVYSEGSMWEYYAPIRPFKKGAAYFACKHSKPILPMAFSYRKPSWIRSKIFGQAACFTLTVGEPIFADETLKGEAKINDLTARTHDAVCRLAGIEPEDNVYGAIFDGDERVDYYTDVYGVGYKKSW